MIIVLDYVLDERNDVSFDLVNNTTRKVCLICNKEFQVATCDTCVQTIWKAIALTKDNFFLFDYGYICIGHIYPYFHIIVVASGSSYTVLCSIKLYCIYKCNQKQH